MAPSLSEFIPDPNNANRGTERGRYVLEQSLQRLGAGRSLVVDKNNVVIAGNQTLQTAVESGFDKAIVVETDGSEFVVVKRTDLDLANDAKAKELALADNRTSELGLEWDADALAEYANMDVDLSQYFVEGELDKLWDGTEHSMEFDAADEVDFSATQVQGDRYPVVAALSWSEHQRWKQWKEEHGYTNDKSAILGMINDGE